MNATALFPRSKGPGVVAGLVPTAPRPLSKTESKEFAALEADIQDRLDRIATHWREIARLLLRIREGGLFRMEFLTFEDYVRQRWGKSARRARQLISAEGVMLDLEAGPSKPKVLPATESQVRALVPLPKEERQAVWDDAVRRAHGGKPVAKHVAEAVKERQWPKPNENGVYQDGQAKKYEFKCPEGWAAVRVLQIDASHWIQAAAYKSSVQAVGKPLTAVSNFSGKPEAVMAALADLREAATSLLNRHVVVPKQLAFARKLIGWCGTLHLKMAQATRDRASSASQPELPFLTRTRPSEQKPAEANPVAVAAHVRNGKRQDSSDQMVDARFKVVDAIVDLRFARKAIDQAWHSAADKELLYHADKAADHLECLKKLLERAENGKGKK